jgi:hypothetical protein
LASDASSGEPQPGLANGIEETKGESILNREFEDDVKEFGAKQQRSLMDADVGEVETAQDGSLKLGSALSAYFVKVCMIEGVFARFGEAAVSAQQRGGMGDGPVAQEGMVGQDRQLNTDVSAVVARCGLAGPRCRHEQ